MPEIVIYSTAMCPYCVRAKMLLQRKGMQWRKDGSISIRR